MKVKIIFVLLIISLLFNLLGLWHLSTGAVVISASKIDAEFDKLKVQLLIAEENLTGTASTNNPIEFYAYVYRANHALLSATSNADILRFPIYQRYFIDISSLGQTLFILERETAMVQGEMISDEFKSINEEYSKSLQNVTENIQRINNTIQSKSASRNSLKSIIDSLRNDVR